MKHIFEQLILYIYNLLQSDCSSVNILMEVLSLQRWKVETHDLYRFIHRETSNDKNKSSLDIQLNRAHMSL